ncbi:unnamed protein product [Onchocerca flexuosa]|uniref:Ovule protein n=1 Tax=Onchocerca flexuosa TaxID=387005 RepID=A0A183HIA8_9BILA|nr:unnamed protein product [Onchocerca flexuosa]
MRFQPVKYPQLKIIIPPSHPSQSSANEAPFSPIKPLFEGFPFQPQTTSQTKTSPIANTSSGSPLSRKISSPLRRSGPSEASFNEILDEVEIPSFSQGRLRALSVSSRTQGSIGNNASSCEAETDENSENLASHSISSESILKSPSKNSADEIQTAASGIPDETKLHHIIVKNEVEEEVSAAMEDIVEKKEMIFLFL